MAPSLHINMPPGDPSDITGYTFTIQDNRVRITEHWRTKDEIYSDGVTVSMPVSVWTSAVMWIVRELKERDGNS